MKQIILSQTGPGASNWVPADCDEAAFGMGFGCVVTGVVNYTLQYAFDDIYGGGNLPTTDRPLGGYNGNYAPAWVTGTAYAYGAFVSNGGYVYQAQSAGVAGASAPTSTNKNVLSSDGTVSWMYVGQLPTPFNHSLVTDATSNTDGSFLNPVKAIRVLVNSGAGNVTVTLLQGIKS